MLATAAAGLAKVADQIVAVDGAYAMFPSAMVRSHPDQSEAIIRACETEDVAVTVHRPNALFFGNEIEKRNLTLRLASAFAEEGDWILVWDGDYHLHHADPNIVRHELANTDCLAATYTILESQDLMSNPDLADHAQKLLLDSKFTIRTRGLYRWTPDLRYEGAHFTMCGTYDGELKWVYGPDLVGARMPGEPALFCQSHDLNRNLVVYHRRNERPLLRRNDADEYYRRRDMAGIEVIDFGDGPVDPDTGRLLNDRAAA